MDEYTSIFYVLHGLLYGDMNIPWDEIKYGFF